MKTIPAHLTRTAISIWILAVIFPGSILSRETVTVSTAAELADAVENANSGGPKTILLNDGTYTLDQMLWVSADGVTIRSFSGNRSAVIVEGQGMDGSVSHIFNVQGSQFTASDMTLRRVANHAVQIHGNNNSDSPVLRNLHILDTFEQMVKVTYEEGNPNSSDNGILDGCLLEYSAGIGPQWYIGGIDVHQGQNWIVRDNVFRNIKSPADTLAEHAIHFWSFSQGTLVERNQIINCDRGIGFGLGDRGHIGGIIRNNMIYHDSSEGFADVGIAVETAPDVMIYNNTVFMENSYPNAIEYRFPETTGLLIANNLTNKLITARDGATAELLTNVTSAQASWFTAVSSGDLHLNSKIPEVTNIGTAVTGLTDDFDKDIRPQDTGIEIGADEISGIPPSFRIELLLNQDSFQPGDDFLLELQAVNSGSAFAADLVILLDVYGAFWFWPGWGQLPDYQITTFPEGTSSYTILDFIWPDTTATASNICFYAACFEPGTWNFVSNISSTCFGFD